MTYVDWNNNETIVTEDEFAIDSVAAFEERGIGDLSFVEDADEINAICAEFGIE